MKRIFFFATPADIKPVLSRFELNAPAKFVQTGMFATPNRPIYLDASEIPAPGIATDETGSFSTTYLVSHRETKNQVYAFRDNTGTLLPGSMTTLHRTAVAQQLMRWFLAALRSEDFKRVEVWWLGREALEMLRNGKRLTTTAEQSRP